MDWIYQGLKFNPDEPFTYEKYGKEWYGFVYVITNRALNKKYIGKKFFWSKKTLPPLKGKKRKRRSIIESNWRDYYGSSANLMEDVETQGKDMFHREIVYLGKGKGDLAYMEAKLQFENEVLLRDDYYNGIINIRLGGNSVKALKSEK
ncbi:MAG: hypothetical protein CBD47_03600 [Synechococcus sp. TMED187]|nr:MAG: hypothetical protein CBD47_03600 [Synechococcus sp. TMED187]